MPKNNIQQAHDPMLQIMVGDDVFEIICREFPYAVFLDFQKVNALLGYRVRIDPEMLSTFGPIARTNTGRIDRRHRWDYYDGFRFRTKEDALLFKLKYA